VIYGHAFPLVGAQSPAFIGNSIQILGVNIFFVISGYLITKGWLRDPNVTRYTIRRALRIMPALMP
jgi:peptidoglycan/LPS O-acetylase OafA/YrhL